MRIYKVFGFALPISPDALAFKISLRLVAPQSAAMRVVVSNSSRRYL